MRDFPNGWVLRLLGDVADTRLGKMLDKGKATGLVTMPYLRNANVQWGRIDTSNLLEMDIANVERDRFSVNNGDLIVCEGGEVGRCAIWRGPDNTVAYQKALHRVRGGPDVDVRYLERLLRLYAIDGTLSRFTTGSTIAHLPQEGLRRLPVPLPPLPEQLRIVELLDDHLSHLDAGVHLLSTAERRTRSFVRAALEAVIPDVTKPGWEDSTVGQAGRLQLGRARHPDWHDGPEVRPYLRVANVFEDRIDTASVMSMDFSGIFEKYRLIDGDVLLNEGQSPHLLGRPAIYRGTPADVAFTNSLIRFQAGSNVLPEWALLVFRRHMHSGRFRRESRITTNIAHLSMARLRNVEFPIPPLDEQQARVRRAQELLAGVDYMEHESQRARAKAVGLRRALLDAAFSGRLTGHASNVDLIEELAAASS